MPLSYNAHRGGLETRRRPVDMAGRTWRPSEAKQVTEMKRSKNGPENLLCGTTTGQCDAANERRMRGEKSVGKERKKKPESNVWSRVCRWKRATSSCLEEVDAPHLQFSFTALFSCFCFLSFFFDCPSPCVRPPAHWRPCSSSLVSLL